MNRKSFVEERFLRLEANKNKRKRKKSDSFFVFFKMTFLFIIEKNPWFV